MTVLLGRVFLLACLLASPAALGQSYPDRNVRTPSPCGPLRGEGWSKGGDPGGRRAGNMTSFAESHRQRVGYVARFPRRYVRSWWKLT